MSITDQHVAAARRAAGELAAAVEGLSRVPGLAQVDLRRLAEDVARIGVDLDLLAGVAPGDARPTLEIIPDGDYPASLFEGAEDEGLGPRRR